MSCPPIASTVAQSAVWGRWSADCATVAVAWGVGRGAWGVGPPARPAARAWGMGHGGAVSPGGSPAPRDELLTHDPDGRRAPLAQVLPVEAELVEPRGPRPHGAPRGPPNLLGIG